MTEKTWKPVVAGILTGIGGVVIGLVVILISFTFSLGSNDPAAFFTVSLGVALAIFIIYSGVMAIQRKRWGLACIASIMASFVLVGIPALILIRNSKREFSDRYIYGLSQIYKTPIKNEELRQKMFVAENGFDRLPSMLGCTKCKYSDKAIYRSIPWCNAPNIPEIKENHCSMFAPRE